MNGPDGSVIIDTEFDTSDVNVGTKEIKNTLVGLRDSIALLPKAFKDIPAIIKYGISSISSNFKGATADLTQFEEETEKLKSKIEKTATYYNLQLKKLGDINKEIENFSKQKFQTEEYKFITKEIDKLGKSLDKVVERKEKFEESGGSSSSATYKNITYEIEKLDRQLKYAITDKERLEKTGQAFFYGSDTDRFSELLGKRTETQGKIEETKQLLDDLINKEVEVSNESERLRKIGENAKISNPHIVKLSQELDRLKARQAELSKAGVGVGFKEFDENSLKIKKLTNEINKYQSGAKKADKSTKKLNSSLKDTKKESNNAQRGIGRMLATSLLFSTVFRAVSLVTNGIKEGIQNLAQYSNDTNKALSNLMSAMTRLKNSFATAFAPLVQFVEPALTRFINHLSQAVTYLGKLFAALTGKDYFEQAIGVQQDYAESLDKTKDSAKKTQKQLAAFDELSVLDFGKDEDEKDKSELKPEDMFQTVQIESNIKAAAQRIKKILAGLFGPLKQSWDENGPYVLDSLKYTASSIKQLASDMGSSFMQVWNAENYGKKITDDLLITFGNLVRTVGNLVTQFDKAWVSGETGTNILRHIGDLILEIMGFFRLASESIMNWSRTIDFTPLLTSFDRVLVALRPIVNDVGSALLWLLNNVLLPITKWGIEQAIPNVFDLIAAALKALKSVIEALKPTALWIWESFLKPLGEWTGDLIIAALEKLTELLNKFSDWALNNQSTVENMTILLVSFFAAWKLKGIIEFLAKVPSLLVSIKNIIGSIKSLEGALYLIKFALGQTNMAFLAVTAVIATIVYLAVQVSKAWDKMTPGEQLRTKILAVAGAVFILAAAISAALQNWVGVATCAALAIAAGVGIGVTASAANKRSTVYTGSISGRTAYPTSAYSAIPYRMPRLATGTVVPPRAGEFAAILGDNKREPEVVSPLSTMKQALKEALFESGMDGKLTIEMIFNGELAALARILRPYIEAEGRRVGVSMVEGV